MVRAARKTNPIIFYHVVCEGESEVFYMEKLVQFFKNNGTHPEKEIRPYRPHVTNNNFTLTDPMHLLDQAKKIKSDKIRFQHPDKMYILLDNDVFLTRQYDKNTFIRACNTEGIIPLFQYNNFEDFVICHLDDEAVTKWKTIVSTYDAPLTSEQVKQEIVSIIPKYRKGSIPADIQHVVFSFEALNRAILHSNDANIPFKSDLITLLREFLCA